MLAFTAVIVVDHTMSDHDQPVAANLLDRQFEAAAPNRAGYRALVRWMRRGHDRVCHRLERQALSRRRPRPVLAVCGRLGRERRQRSPPDHQGAGDGTETTVPGDRPVAPLRPGLHVRERGLPGAPGCARDRLQHDGSGPTPRLRNSAAPVRYQPRAESRTGTGCSAEATGKPMRRRRGNSSLERSTTPSASMPPNVPPRQSTTP